MNFLSYSPPQLQRAFEALGITLLHSLWQGLLLMVLLWSLLHFIRYEKSNLRFVFAFATLMIMLLGFLGTFYYEWDSLKPLAAVNQNFSPEAISLTDLEVSHEPTLWEQIKSKPYTLFYQLAENARLLAILWLVGSLFFSFRLSLGLWQIHQLKQERQALPELWKTKVSDLQKTLNIRQRVDISLNPTLDSPITLGWLKPMILLPASMLSSIPADQLESILVHELAHIRRHDYLWNLLQSVTEIILFYHPAYWYIASVLEQEREHACDIITLKVTGRPQIYAQALLQVASLRTSLSTVGLSARGKGRSGFAERIRRIVAPQQKKKGVQPLPFLLSFCLIGFLLFAFTLKSPFEEQDLPEQETETATMDTLLYAPYLQILDGYGQLIFNGNGEVGDIRSLPSTGVHLPEEIDYAPSFDEVMAQVPDIMLDTSSLTIGEVYDQYVSLDQSLNSLYKSLNEMKGLNSEKVNVNYSASNVLYLLDGVAVNPKNVMRSEVNDMQIYPSHLIEGVDTSRYKLVVKASHKFNTQKKVQANPNANRALQTDSLRSTDYVRHSSRMDLDIPLYKELVKSSSNHEDYIVGMARSSDKEINPWTYLKEDALYLLDGKVVDDPESIMMSDIAKVEIYHEPLPAALQNLRSRTYSTVVRALSEIPVAEAARSSIRVSGLVLTGKDRKVIPVPNIPVRIQSTGEQTITNPNGRYEFSSVGKKDTLLFYLPSGKNALKVPVDNRENLTVTTYIPKNLYQNKFNEALRKRMAPEVLQKDRKAIDKRFGLMDSSIYDVMVDKILVNLNNNAVKFKSDAIATGDEPNKYSSIGDPEVLFTLDGVVTDPRTVDRKLVDGASFETRDVPNGYQLVIKAVSKTAAEAAKKESQKTIVRGTVTDQKTGKPLAGTFILVKGTTTPTVTDLNGRYQLELPPGSGELVFTFTGYETRTEPIKNSKILEIEMLPETEQEALTEKKLVGGRVVDDKTGEPLAGVEVYSEENGVRIEGISTFTNQNGEYQFAVPASFKVLVHSKEGYPDHLVPIRYLTEDKAKNWEIVMKKQSQVSEKADTRTNPLIQGQVTDAKTGQGIPGVNVLISGTTTGTVTNRGGRYLLKLTDDAESLSFNAIGYQKQQIPIGSGAELNAILLLSETSQIPNDQDSILFIIDDVVRRDIKSFQELDEKYPMKSPYNISMRGGAIDPSMVPSMNPAQLKPYKRLVIINTPKTYVEPDNIARGRVIDDKTKKPLAGVEVSALDDDKLKTYTDEQGEYELPLNAETKYLQHSLEGYLPFVTARKTVTTFENPILMPLRKVEGDAGFESKLKVFPNPGNDKIKVSFALPEAGPIQFELLDKEGNTLYKKVQHYNISENHEVIIPSENFRPDTYLLRIKLNGESVVRRVILK